MHKKMISLAVLTALIFTAVPIGVSAKTKGELQRLYDTVANHIIKNEELLSSLITDEEDAICASAVIIARDILLSGNVFSDEDIKNAYEALYSAYSKLTLIEQRGSELTTDSKLNLLVTLSVIILTDDYYALIDADSANGIKAEAENAKAAIANRQNLNDVDFSSVVQRYYEILYTAASLKLKSFTENLITSGFYDVRNNDWFRDAVKFVYDNGLFKGTSDTEFSPQITMTRAMFITVLSRLANADVDGFEPFFDDVDSDMYYAAPVYWAHANGIISWSGDISFMPDEPITREEMVMSMYNLSVLKGLDVTNYDKSSVQSISDIDRAHESAVEPLRWSYANGVISGYGDGSIKPTKTATRAEVAQVFVNFSVVN